MTQHANETGFLWLLRENATREPHYSLKDPAKLVGSCVKKPWGSKSLEIFAAGVLAFERRETPVFMGSEIGVGVSRCLKQKR